MARIKILTPHSLGGGVDVFPGDVVEMEEPEAGVKVRRGWAEYSTERVAAREPEPEKREPKVLHREPQGAGDAGDEAKKPEAKDKK